MRAPVNIREHIPLEQGLRPLVNFLYFRYPNHQRAYSIRTRIKTFCGKAEFIFFDFIREHIPLEQGLRPQVLRPRPRLRQRIREHIPLEQGLRQ